MYPPQFSYGMPQNYGAMAGPASWGAAAVAGVPSALSTVGMAAGLGSLFSASPVLRGLSFLDPTTAGIEMGIARFGAQRAMGAGIGSALGAGVMAGAGPLALGMAAYEGVRYTGQQYMTGAREQLQLGAQLSGLGFANAQSMSGRGFGFQQTRQIGSMMRELDAHDPFTTMHELNQSMDQFMGMGMHRGVQDAREFSRKFKEFTTTIHEMAKQLGTTMEDAGKLFGVMSSSGFYTSADVMGNTRSMRTARGMGMDEGSYLGMQSQGSAISRASLMSGRAGALTASRFAGDVLIGATSRASGGAGFFRGTDLMDMTGTENVGDAAAALGTQFTGVMANYLTGTAGGRAMLAGLGEQRDGSFTGAVDLGQISKFAGGRVKLSELAGIGQGRLATGQSRASFKTSEHKIASSVLESASGVDAVLTAIDQEAKEHFKGQIASDDAMKLFYEKQLGVDARFSDALVEMVKNRTQSRLLWMRKVREEQRTADLQLDMKRNYTLSGLMTQVGGGISDLFAPVKQAGADMVVGTQMLGQSAYDSVLGIERSSMTDASKRASLMRFAGGTATPGARTGTTLDDFSSGSVARGVAAATSPAAARAQVERWASGEAPTAAGLLGSNSDASRQLTAFMATPGGADAKTHILRAREARQLGDTAAAEEHLAQARALVGEGFSTETRKRKDGSTMTVRNAFYGVTQERDLAAVMAEVGDAQGARLLAAKGTTKDHAYGDVKSAHDAAREALDSMGIEAGLAEQLSTGGVGSELMAASAGKGLGYLGGLQDRPDVKAKLAGLDEGSAAWNDVLARAASEELGGSFTGTDVETVRKAAHQAGKGLRRGKAMLEGGVFETATSKERMKWVEETWKGSAGKIRTSIDTQVGASTLRAAGVGLGMASPELRAALGSSYDAALRGLQTVSSGGDTAPAFAAVDRMLEEAGRGEGVGSIRGGQEVALLAEKRKTALERAAAGDAEAVAEAYGVAGGRSGLVGFAKEMKLNTPEDLDANDLDALVRRLASVDAAEQLAGGEGGNLLRRGLSVEQQISEDLRLTSEQVQKTAEAVRDLQTNSQRGWFAPPLETKSDTAKPAGTQ